MSKEALAKVVQRAISDAAFRRQLNSDPTGALRGFDLSADEASALRTGDAGRLSSLGVDQRMSKSFALGGLASTRTSSSDLTPGGGPSVDASGSEAMRSADIDGGTSGTGTVRAGDDWKFADRVAADGTSTRVGDDWKFADKSAGGNMANYPAHDGLAGPSGVSSVRAGDDWKFADSTAATAGSVAPVEGSPEATASEIASGGVARANVIHDDPNGFLAANADADVTGGSAATPDAFIDESESYLTKVGYDTSASGGTEPTVIHDDPDGFLAANADDTGSGPESAAPDIGTHHPS